MFDWLRYLPFAIRADLKSAPVKGPYFSKLHPRRWDLVDNVFHFSVPWSNSVWGLERYSTKVDSVSPEKGDILKQGWNHSGSDKDVFYRWRHNHFFFRTWLFLMPWFARARGRLSLSATLIERGKKGGYQGVNFYHPRVFETIIADYLNAYYGHKYTQEGTPRYRGPLNWRILPLSSSIQAICLDIHHIGNTSIEYPKPLRLVFFPVTQSHFILLEFDFGGALLNGNRFDLTPMLDLTNSIINSFSLEVGPQTQQQWNDVKKTCPDMSYVSEFAELKWPIAPEDIGKPQAEAGLEIEFKS